MNRTVFFISDGTGITAEAVGHAVLSQFSDLHYQEVTLPFIDTPAKAEATATMIDRVAEDSGIRPIVFTTLTESTLLECFVHRNVFLLDLFSLLMPPLAAELGCTPIHRKGQSHGLVNKDSYDIRIAAINFALDHDDGLKTQHYQNAEVIFVGVSRTGKTPTSLYLAMQFGIKAANYPLTQEDLQQNRLTGTLEPFRQRLCGLTISPERLHMLRTSRFPGSEYASLPQCRRELKQAEEILRANGIPLLDTTTLSIEEIAAMVIQRIGLKRRII